MHVIGGFTDAKKKSIQASIESFDTICWKTEIMPSIFHFSVANHKCVTANI